MSCYVCKWAADGEREWTTESENDDDNGVRCGTNNSSRSLKIVLCAFVRLLFCCRNGNEIGAEKSSHNNIHCPLSAIWPHWSTHHYRHHHRQRNAFDNGRQKSPLSLQRMNNVVRFSICRIELEIITITIVVPVPVVVVVVRSQLLPFITRILWSGSFVVAVFVCLLCFIFFCGCIVNSLCSRIAFPKDPTEQVDC